jgi:hypothetical protein
VRLVRTAGLVFLGYALGAFAIGCFGGDSALFAGQIPETRGPVFESG